MVTIINKSTLCFINLMETLNFLLVCLLYTEDFLVCKCDCMSQFSTKHSFQNQKRKLVSSVHTTKGKII